MSLRTRSFLSARLAMQARPQAPTSYPRPPAPYSAPGHVTYMRPTVSRQAGMAGDPGIFGSIGRFLGGAVSSIPFVGGIAGGALTGLANAIDPVKTPPIAAMPGVGIQGLPTFQQAPQKVPGVAGLLQRGIPGGETGYTCPAGKPPSGYHVNKSSYWLMDGTFVPEGTKWVKNRRRNPANSRATNRAISRVASAKKHAQTLSRITIRAKK